VTRRIVITSCPLSVPKSQTDEMLSDDRVLADAMTNVVGDMKTKGVDVFEHERNRAVTERGYLFALYEDDLIAAGSEIEN